MVLCLKDVPPMRIERGLMYKNKTLKYLVPALNYYGSTLKAKINLIFILSFGIFDNLLEGSHLEGQKNIFILIDRKVNPSQFENFMNWVKLQEYYITDYVYDDLEKGCQQMLVLKFPTPLEDAYSKFLKGQYSKMYTKEEIETYFKGKEATEVFRKSFSAKQQFISTIKEVFDTSLEETDFINHQVEYDIPPVKEQEFFNNL